MFSWHYWTLKILFLATFMKNIYTRLSNERSNKLYWYLINMAVIIIVIKLQLYTAYLFVEFIGFVIGKDNAGTGWMKSYEIWGERHVMVSKAPGVVLSGKNFIIDDIGENVLKQKQN